MEELDIKVNLNYKTISLSYSLFTLFWQLPTIWFSLLISKGTNDTRLTFIIETYVGHALMAGCISSYLTTYWYFLANIADRFCIMNEGLRLIKSFSRKH